MSHLAGNRHHDLLEERRTARARPADGRPRVSADNQTLRSDKGRNYTERGGAHPAVTFDPELPHLTVQRAPPARSRLAFDLTVITRPDTRPRLRT
jgi:hypothetical protein